MTNGTATGTLTGTGTLTSANAGTMGGSTFSLTGGRSNVHASMPSLAFSYDALRTLGEL